MNYKVTAPLVIIPAADGTSSDWYGYAGAVVPQGHNDERVKVLAEEGFLAEVKADDGNAAKEPTVAEVLAEVGDDQAKAAAALEAEKAGKNRTSLVSKLEAIANPAS